jgi:hypothetical protein
MGKFSPSSHSLELESDWNWYQAQWEILGTLLNGGTLLLRTSDWHDVLKRVSAIYFILTDTY